MRCAYPNFWPLAALSRVAPDGPMVLPITSKGAPMHPMAKALFDAQRKDAAAPSASNDARMVPRFNYFRPTQTSPTSDLAQEPKATKPKAGDAEPDSPSAALVCEQSKNAKQSFDNGTPK